MSDGEGKELRFKAETVELELTVAVEKAREQGLKVRFWVLDTQADRRRTAGVTQVIRLTMRPVLGLSPEQAALIGGTGLEGEE